MSPVEVPAIAGVVLAGGRSRRFGRDKALALLDGAPLIHWSLEALRPACAVLAVNGPASLAERFGLGCVADAEGAAEGPLAGVLGALAWAADQGCAHVLTAPCDTPFLPKDMAERLAAHCRAGDTTPVIAARAERPHPLCALWRVDAASALAEFATAPKQPSLQAIVEALGGGWTQFPDERAFANLNTEAELDLALSARARRRG